MNDLIYKLLYLGFIRFYSRRFNLTHKEEIELLREVKNENKG